MSDIIELDARNLMCPLPVIRAQDKIKTMRSGQLLNVVCSDPGALNDIPAWCRINGHRVVSSQHDDSTISVLVEVGGSID
ncbi:MAG: sulfurtransferase TusA family protein [Proteobacteria bacterium]|nr:sulfurtransferase TusA family protein [Pseudomonadota bacterium]